MPAEENIQLMKRWYQQVWNEKSDQTIHDLFAPDAVAWGTTDAPIRGPVEFVSFVQQIRTAFPDINITVEDAFASGDKVVARWSATMTHSGPGMGPATGNKVQLTGMSIARFRDGQIVEGWDNWDQLGMLEQIGAYQRPSTAMLEKSA
ncbi:MAG TPA: ester cyclase [Terriglobales bacterium]